MSTDGDLGQGMRSFEETQAKDEAAFERVDQVIFELRRERALNNWRDRVEEAFRAKKGAA